MERTGFILLMLIAAVLACVCTAPTPEDVPSVADLATATPGGQISVSQLTETLPAAGSQSDAQVIGPVATQTAAAEEMAALTATAMQPTPTIPGIFTNPAVCPPPGNPTLPSEPPPFQQYAEMLASFLSEGGAPTVLEATLRSWNAIGGTGGLIVSDRDLTGDGVPEILVIVQDPRNNDRFPQPGDMFVFGCNVDSYRLLYTAGYALTRGTPVLFSADDLNGNFINDLVYSVQFCEGAVCFQDVNIVEWSLQLETFERLHAEDIVEPFAQIEVFDANNDGLQEVTVSTGTVAAPEAGPQRTYTTTYRWDGSLFTISQRVAATAQYRIHVIHDADDAAAIGDYSTAISRYRTAIDDPNLQSWTYPDESAYLRAYASYRLMIVQTLDGRYEQAAETHEELDRQYAVNYDASGEDDEDRGDDGGGGQDDEN
ncbi:MAG: hypothetical protein ACFB51_01055, partial [Anaerolineae bacterium]